MTAADVIAASCQVVLVLFAFYIGYVIGRVK